MADRISWDACPRCDDLIALGWKGEELTEYDCVGGCVLNAEELVVLRGRGPDNSGQVTATSRRDPAGREHSGAN
ncbi:MAG: hypothetical protein JWO98_4827 [Frankiales bacterium]|nr:hypothetical protein [Frankiales bacterium]